MPVAIVEGLEDAAAKLRTSKMPEAILKGLEDAAAKLRVSKMPKVSETTRGCSRPCFSQGLTRTFSGRGYF